MTSAMFIEKKSFPVLDMTSTKIGYTKFDINKNPWMIITNANSTINDSYKVTFREYNFISVASFFALRILSFSTDNNIAKTEIVKPIKTPNTVVMLF